MIIKWEEIPTNDNGSLVSPDYQKYNIRTFIAPISNGYLFKQMMGIQCFGITFIPGEIK